ncbi:hypothetical protein DES53_102774 [Roseimicrobium gellanilyticum]|uniref:Uncharacterized protein n=1 Tax=Roseimicrobium gellanilyticum TaxID=748857 RepID=A0A366HTX5_9BACT|nr:hypothetical protein DES53_102774 [Roseimicrobium gellanilyticum]
MTDGFCKHPFCLELPAEGGFRRAEFCSTSCRVGYHRHHKKRLRALYTNLTAYAWSQSPLPFLVRDHAVEVYRISHGLPARKRGQSLSDQV